MRDICGMSAGHAARCPRGRRLPLVVGYTWDDCRRSGSHMAWLRPEGCSDLDAGRSRGGLPGAAADCLGHQQSFVCIAGFGFSRSVLSPHSGRAGDACWCSQAAVAAWRGQHGQRGHAWMAAAWLGDVRERRDSGATHRGISQPATQRTGPPGPLDGWVTQGACPVGGSRPALVEGVSWLPPRITGCAARRLPVVCRNRCSFVPLLWRTPRVRSAPSR